MNLMFLEGAITRKENAVHTHAFAMARKLFTLKVENEIDTHCIISLILALSGHLNHHSLKLVVCNKSNIQATSVQ